MNLEKFLKKLAKLPGVEDVKIVEDREEAVVIAVTAEFEDEVRTQLATVRIKHRGTDKERVLWDGNKPEWVLSLTRKRKLKDVLTQALAQLDGLVILSSKIFNMEEGYIAITGFFEVEPGVVEPREYLIIPEGNGIKIYRVVKK